jgi:carbonic anhydrase
MIPDTAGRAICYSRRKEAMLRAALLTAALGLFACLPAVHAADAVAPLSPEESLKLLMSGNRRYASGHPRHPHQNARRRAEIAAGQHPFASILSCADSRVPPEIVFDEGLGDLFVTRLAGNIADDGVIGSLEYASEHLHVPLIVVLGHTNCGAIAAAAAGGEAHDHVRTLVEALKPAIDKARTMPGDLQANAVRVNVEMTVARLRASEPTLSKLVREGKLRVVGAIYDLKTGRVDWAGN